MTCPWIIILRNSIFGVDVEFLNCIILYLHDIEAIKRFADSLSEEHKLT